MQNGTLHKGDVPDRRHRPLAACVPCATTRAARSPRPALPPPVEITGLTEVPAAGDLFEAVEDERLARELADKRTAEAKEKQFAAYTKVTLDNLFEPDGRRTI